VTAYIPAAKSEDWRTPPEVVHLVRQALGGRINLDPCASREGEPLADTNFIGPPDGVDGLSAGWSGTVYVNPPFGSLRHWVEKCQREHEEHLAEIVLLMPARTDTNAWHRHVSTASAICLWKGRMTFVGAEASCPFPVAIVYWGQHVIRFRETFQSHGMIFRP